MVSARSVMATPTRGRTRRRGSVTTWRRTRSRRPARFARARRRDWPARPDRCPAGRAVGAGVAGVAAAHVGVEDRGGGGPVAVPVALFAVDADGRARAAARPDESHVPRALPGAGDRGVVR